MKRSKILFLISFIYILFVGFFFRFYQLGKTPSGVYLDEASIGYNAFSILKTGKDEYGLSLPLLFRSVGDFKTPTYIYLTVPSVAVFGLTPFSVRLPSAIFGFLTVPLIFILIKKLSRHKKVNSIAIISTFFLSISPWHIILSRTAYETTVALFLLLSAIYIFLVSLEKPKYFPLSAFLFGLSFISYHAERLLSPIVLISLLIFFRKQVFKDFKKKLPIFILSFIVGIIITGPTIFLMRSPGFLKRASTLNIFSYDKQHPYGYSENLPNILNNNFLLSAREFSSLYVSYFSPRYLFSLGDSSPRSSLPGIASFFVWQFPLYLIGLYSLVKNKIDRELKFFVLTLLLVSPIPAALTRDPYSIIRALPMVISLIIIMSLGVEKISGFISKIPQKLLIFGVFIFISFSILKLFVAIFYYNDYFNFGSWNYGWEQVVNFIPKLDPKLPIVIDKSRGEPYINILFFTKYDPAKYQKNNFEVNSREYYNNLDRNPIKNIGNITVKSFEWGKDTDMVEQYLVADNIAISEEQIKNHNLTIVHEIYYPNNEIAFRILRSNPKKP